MHPPVWYCEIIWENETLFCFFSLFPFFKYAQLLRFFFVDLFSKNVLYVTVTAKTHVKILGYMKVLGIKSTGKILVTLHIFFYYVIQINTDFSNKKYWIHFYEVHIYFLVQYYCFKYAQNWNKIETKINSVKMWFN